MAKKTSGFEVVARIMRNIANEGLTGDDALVELEKRLIVHEALEQAKRMSTIEGASLIVDLKVGARKAMGREFTPEDGDVVRAILYYYGGAQFVGFGEVDSNSIAEAIGRKPTSTRIAGG